MKLNQIKTFQLAAEFESFSRAADEQFVTQPAVSLQIRQLERALGATLFERNGKRIKLTRAGEIALAYARQVGQLTDDLRRELRSLEIESKSVSIGCSTTSARYYMPLFLAELRAKAPNIKVRVSITSPDRSVAALANGDLDLILTTDASVSSRIVAERCWVSRLFVIAPAGHPLTRRSQVDLTELARQPFVLLPPPWSGPALFRRWAAEHHLEFEVVMEATGFDSLKELVREGVGLSVVSERSIVTDLAEGKIGIVSVQGMPLELPVFVAHAAGQDLSDEVRIVWDLLLNGRWRDRLPRLGNHVSNSGLQSARSGSRTRMTHASI